jgi:hypothetical protein
MHFDPATVDLSVFGNNPDATLAAAAAKQITDKDWAEPEVVNDIALWTAHIQSCGDPTYLTWCWKSTQAHQKPLLQAPNYAGIRQAASLWLTILKRGNGSWWEELRQHATLPIESWAFSVALARDGDLDEFATWCKNTYSATSMAGRGFQIFWELALLGSRESLHVEDTQSILWPYFLDTLLHVEHHPAGLPQHLLPQMGKYGPIVLPVEISTWLRAPSPSTAAVHEKHEPASRWKHLWDAWLPSAWRQEIAVGLVEIMETARASGAAVTLSDEIRTIWMTGPTFDREYTARLARAMLIAPRSGQHNTWSDQRTEHWIDDIEHFYPDASILRDQYMTFDGISVEIARDWLTQQAYPLEAAKLPVLQLDDNSPGQSW